MPAREQQISQMKNDQSYQFRLFLTEHVPNGFIHFEGSNEKKNCQKLNVYIAEMFSLKERKKSHEEASHIIQQPEMKPSVTVLDVNWLMMVQ